MLGSKSYLEVVQVHRGLILSKHYFIKNTYYHHRVFVDTEGYEGYQRILKDTNASSWIPNDTNAYPW